MTSPKPYRKSHPIDFSLTDVDHQQVLYIECDGARPDLVLNLVNRSPHVIELNGKTGSEPSEKNHHFALSFRAGTLSDRTLASLSGPQFADSLVTPGWKIAPLKPLPAPNEIVTLHFLFTGDEPWHPKKEQRLMLRGFSAAPGAGARGTQIELAPNQLTYLGNATPITHTRTQYLYIAHRSGGTMDPPLHVTVVNGRSVVSDGHTPSDVTLRISNALHAGDLTFKAQESKIRISYDVGSDAWALVRSGSAADVVGIRVKGVAGKGYPASSSQGKRPGWLIRFFEDFSLGPSEAIEVTLKVVPAGHGEANVYLQYENIVGYPEGRSICPLEKTLLVQREAGVGIGTPEPTGRLNVVGSEGVGRGIQLDSGEIKLRHDPSSHLSIVNRQGALFFETSSDPRMGASGHTLMSIEASHETATSAPSGYVRVGNVVHVGGKTGPIVGINKHGVSFSSKHAGETFELQRSDDHLVISFGGGHVRALSVDKTGKVMIGQLVDAKGVAKTFIIEHPQDDERYLVHATLEGPEAAVYYRGTARLRAGRARVQLPAYFEALTQTEGRTVMLTNVDGFAAIAVQTNEGAQIKDGAFVVTCADRASEQAFNWEVKAVRKDVDPLEVEPKRSALRVEGFGPYAYGIPARQGP